MSREGLGNSNFELHDASRYQAARRALSSRHRTTRLPPPETTSLRRKRRMSQLPQISDILTKEGLPNIWGVKVGAGFVRFICHTIAR